MNLKPIIVGACLMLASLGIYAQPEPSATHDWELHANNPQAVAHIQFLNLDPNKNYIYSCNVVHNFFQGARIKLDRDVLSASLDGNELKLKHNPSKQNESDNVIQLAGAQNGNENYWNSFSFEIKGDQKELNISLLLDDSAEIQKKNTDAILSTRQSTDGWPAAGCELSEEK